LARAGVNTPSEQRNLSPPNQRRIPCEVLLWVCCAGKKKGGKNPKIMSEGGNRKKPPSHKRAEKDNVENERVFFPVVGVPTLKNPQGSKIPEIGSPPDGSVTWQVLRVWGKR